jgi:16S rRNA processing protein RimM
MYLIGYVRKAQGVRGELKVEPVSSDLERYNHLDTIHIKSENINKTYPVERVRISDRYVFLKISGIDTRDDAEVLSGAEILIGEEHLLKPSAGEYFIHDLVGCLVYSEEGSLLGQLQEVVQLTSNDIWIIKDEMKREILIPAIKDVIRQVDVSNKEITIHVIEGLLE